MNYQRIAEEAEKLSILGKPAISTVILKGIDIYLTSPRDGGRMDWFWRFDDAFMAEGATVVLCNEDIGFAEEILASGRYEIVTLPPEIEEARQYLERCSLWRYAADVWMGENIHPILAFMVLRRTARWQRNVRNGFPLEERTTAPEGYWGNLDGEQGEYLTDLTSREEFPRIERFEALCSTSEGSPVQFFYLTESIPRAPPEGFVWARSNNHTLQIYFSSLGLAEKFETVFSYSLRHALDTVAFHEYQEVVCQVDHPVANQLTLQQFAGSPVYIGYRLDGFFNAGTETGRAGHIAAALQLLDEARGCLFDVRTEEELGEDGQRQECLVRVREGIARVREKVLKFVETAEDAPAGRIRRSSINVGNEIRSILKKNRELIHAKGITASCVCRGRIYLNGFG